jgi:hypothetical protein
MSTLVAPMIGDVSAVRFDILSIQPYVLTLRTKSQLPVHKIQISDPHRTGVKTLL